MDIGKLLDETGAILHGHFILSSGRHSEVYFEKFRLLERPDVLTPLCSAIAEHFRETPLDFIAGPTTGGIILAFEVARQMGLPAVYIESEDGVKKLRRNKTIAPGSKCIVVDDVLTMGTSLLESREAIERAGGTVLAYAALIDRSQSGLDLGLPIFSSYTVTAQSYPSDALPEWLATVPVTKPGTRK